VITEIADVTMIRRREIPDGVWCMYLVYWVVCLGALIKIYFLLDLNQEEGRWESFESGLSNA